MRNAPRLILMFALSACSKPDEQAANALQANTNPDFNATEPVVAKTDAVECDKAKAAAVASRSKYDRDYESRNPGFQSMSVAKDDLTSCRLSAAGAFVGKWSGANARWRFVPKKAGKYLTDPKQVWVGENEGLDDLSWFSEWRSEGATVAKNEQLNSLIKSARKIYG